MQSNALYARFSTIDFLNLIQYPVLASQPPEAQASIQVAFKLFSVVIWTPKHFITKAVKTE